MFFELDGKKYEYAPIAGERSIELPIAFDYVKRFAENEYLEVGFVLAYHLFALSVRNASHFVIDKYEKHDNYLDLWNIDIVDYVPEFYYKACFCVSTLEHVGWDIPETRDDDKVLQALCIMRTAIQEPGLLFVTIPLGYNEVLDGYIRSERVTFDKMLCMKQVEAGVWVQVDLKDIIDIKYGYPFAAANGLVIGVDNGFID